MFDKGLTPEDAARISKRLRRTYESTPGGVPSKKDRLEVVLGQTLEVDALPARLRRDLVKRFFRNVKHDEAFKRAVRTYAIHMFDYKPSGPVSLTHADFGTVTFDEARPFHDAPDYVLKSFLYHFLMHDQYFPPVIDEDDVPLGYPSSPRFRIDPYASDDDDRPLGRRAS